MLSSIDLKDLLAIVIAATSLFVSVFTLWLQRRDKKEKLRIKASLGFTVGYGGAGEPLVIIEASNVGERPVTISSFGLLLPNKQVLIYPFARQHVQLPYELRPGKSCSMHIPAKEVAKAVKEQGYSRQVKLKPQYSAQSGAKFTGKYIKFNSAAWQSGA